MKAITIRQFGLSDLDQVCAIELKCFSSYWSRSDFILCYSQNQKTFLVAETDGQVVGYVVAITETSYSSSIIRGHILNFAVDPSFRCRGIGKNLIISVISCLQDQFVDDIYLEVRASNRAAKELYLNLGFKETREIKGYYHDEDAVTMEKKLKRLIE